MTRFQPIRMLIGGLWIHHTEAGRGRFSDIRKALPLWTRHDVRYVVGRLLWQGRITRRVGEPYRLNAVEQTKRELAEIPRIAA